jgi:hypothetical protein
LRDVEEMLAQRGLEASDETVRCCTVKLGRAAAPNLRRSSPTRTHALQQSNGALAFGHSTTAAKTTEAQVSTFSAKASRDSRRRPQQLQRSMSLSRIQYLRSTTDRLTIFTLKSLYSVQRTTQTAMAVAVVVKSWGRTRQSEWRRLTPAS